jgi:hypothetical protein
MHQERKSEWLEGADWELFERQYREPYRINLAFFSWLADCGVLASNRNKQILYVGAGMGANLFHVHSRYPGNIYKGVDLNPECVRKGNERLQSLNATDCSLEVEDLYQFPPAYCNSFNGIFSLATLSWLPDFESAANCFVRQNPEWIAATSLFYDGPVDATIKISDYTKPISGSESTEKFYNVYSLPRVKEFFGNRGYTEFCCQPFEIDIDLPKPDHRGMGTYTEQLANGRRLQISGPVLMNWYFILAKKEKKTKKA